MKPNEFFLDTSFAIALSVASDRHHPQALALANQLASQKARLVTTHAVQFEIGNALSKLRYRNAAVRLIESLQQDPQVESLPVTADLFHSAFELFRSRPDKEWGLIDCLSFVVMEQRGLTEALTADEHFVQAGFRALLRD